METITCKIIDKKEDGTYVMTAYDKDGNQLNLVPLDEWIKANKVTKIVFPKLNIPGVEA